MFSSRQLEHPWMQFAVLLLVLGDLLAVGIEISLHVGCAEGAASSSEHSSSMSEHTDSSATTGHALRFLSGDGGEAGHESHLSETGEVLEVVAHYASLSILSILLAIQLLTVYAVGPCHFASHPVHVLDLLVLLVAIGLESVASVSPTADIIVIALGWRVVRVAHAFFETGREDLHMLDHVVKLEHMVVNANVRLALSRSYTAVVLRRLQQRCAARSILRWWAARRHADRDQRPRRTSTVGLHVTDTEVQPRGPHVRGRLLNAEAARAEGIDRLPSVQELVEARLAALAESDAPAMDETKDGSYDGPLLVEPTAAAPAASVRAAAAGAEARRRLDFVAAMNASLADVGQASASVHRAVGRRIREGRAGAEREPLIAGAAAAEA